jgi:ATP-binding cassette, subfamily F, member 3
MLHINELTYRLGDRLLIDRASVAIPDGAHVGLVGRNGTGKTTLFKLILGELATEAGGVTLPKGVRIGTVAQEAPGGAESLVEVVLAADLERASLMHRRENEGDPMAIAEIETRLSDLGAHAAPARAAAILHGLGFDAAAQLRSCSSFSGGWRMRVALAATLFAEPDLLLLDEPTNYLDLEGTLWLYDYLGKYPHTAVTISHDRELLDTVVDHILHLDQGKLNVYRGGYTAFERLRAEQIELTTKAAAKQDLERKHLQSFVDRFKAKASKAKQAQSRMKRLEKLQPVTGMTQSDVLPFYLPGPARPASPPLITLEGVSAGYGDHTVLNRLNLTLLPDDRIALLGSNGNGKSTFCKLISGKLKPLTGEAKIAPKASIAYFAQHQVDELHLNQSAFDHVKAVMPDTPEAKVRAVTARFGFSGTKSDTKVAQLSGGEKARLMLGLVGMKTPHLLILDEPTNHLDVDSRQALLEAINDFPGAVILVSHDRFLIEGCADRLWLVNDGSVKAFDGDLDDYRDLVLGSPQARENKKSEIKQAKAEQRREATVQRASLSTLRKQVEVAEAKMAKLNDLIARVDKALSDGKAFQTDLKKAAVLARQRAELGIALEQTEEEWLAACASLESA